jgi:TfoX/Sxy family transcriptional regulator of competence genes
VAYDETLADRAREALGARAGVTERRMFGGIGFMIEGNMACGVHGEELIVRLEPEEAERALGEPGTRIFDITGRPTKGWLLVSGGALADGDALQGWVDAGADFATSLPPKEK